MYNRVILILLAVVICSCSPRTESFLDYDSKSEELIRCYKIADSLIEQMSVKNNAPMSILRTSFTDTNEHQRSTSVGLYYSDAVASRMAQRGFKIIEPSLDTRNQSKNINNQEEKQALDSSATANRAKVEAILVGYFQVSKAKKNTTLFVKILDARTNAIIASDESEL